MQLLDLPLISDEIQRIKEKRARKEIYKRRRPRFLSQPITYAQYISSISWRKRADQFFARHGRKCQACGSTKSVTVHHMTYARLKKERYEDLVAFCWPCHEEFHSRYGSDQDMVAITIEFIEEKKQLALSPVA